MTRRSFFETAARAMAAIATAPAALAVIPAPKPSGLTVWYIVRDDTIEPIALDPAEVRKAFGMDAP